MLCPHCQVPILSRRNPMCPACHQPLPVELVLTVEEVARIEAEEQARDRSGVPQPYNPSSRASGFDTFVFPTVQEGLKCPECRAPVLSRRHSLCSTCHKPLPADFVFTAEQLEAGEAKERDRARAIQLRQEERQRQAARNHQFGGSDGGGF